MRSKKKSRHWTNIRSDSFENPDQNSTFSLECLSHDHKKANGSGLPARFWHWIEHQLGLKDHYSPNKE